MLEIKAPWDQRVIEKIKFQKPNQIEEILESAKTNSLKKGSDFNIIQRIDVLESFNKPPRASSIFENSKAPVDSFLFTQ